MDSGRGWKRRRLATLKFYRNKLGWKEKQFNHKFPLHMYFAPMIGDKKEVSIADLGAGMFSTTGNLWYQTEVKVYPSDFLADDFKFILDEAKVIPGIPVLYEDMEHLTYKDESFDIVHCVNALDHCEHPEGALREMNRICKKGGWIYLRHMQNNATIRRNTGFHQWNIDLFGDHDCIFASESSHFLLSTLDYRFRTKMRKDIGNEPEMVVSMLHKI